MRNVIDILKERGFIDAITSEDLREATKKPLKVYHGIDPSSDSLHIGNLIGLIVLAWFQRCGHIPVAVVGGATGMIGDPSGKSSERNLLSPETIEKNIVGIRKNIESVLSKSTTDPLIIMNNYDWFKDFSFLSFLRDVGKFFRIGPMLAKESVKQRFTSEEGLSFTEFSYQVLQGYDFLHLFQNHQVMVQFGGSDQWGNITAGTDLIRKVTGKSAFGLTYPLLLRSDGQKFGKSEKGAIWLSSEKLSPYEFYQYLVRMPDADVIKMMKLLTFMEMEEIVEYEKQMSLKEYIPNTAQKRLAEEVTKIVHGKEALEKALKVTSNAAPGAKTSLDPKTLEALTDGMETRNLPLTEVLQTRLVDLLASAGLQPSKGEAKRLIRNGGVYLNNEQIKDENFSISKENLIDGRMLLLSLGKKNKALIKIDL